MDVSIIIVNYNTSDMVLDCIGSIRKESKETPYEIIVVDNNSEEGQKSKLRGHDNFTLIELTENIGFGRANNIGAKKATGKVLFLLNPDTLLANDAVSILYRYMSERPDVGICGGNLYDREMNPTHSFHMLHPSILYEVDFALNQVFRRIRYGKNIQFNHSDKPIDVAIITGADLMISKEVWEKVEGFSPDYFMYYEDAELCYQVKKLGYRIVSVPESKIIHLEGGSFTETEKHCRRILEGRFTFFKKHYSRFYNISADTCNIVSLVIAILICKLVKRQEKEYNYKIRLNTYIKYLRGKL